MTKVFGYSRVSSPGQVDADGLVRQEAAIKSFCVDNCLELVAIYREEGVSGTIEGMHRPKWVEMLLEMEKQGITTIVIEGLDRLARDLMVSEYIISDLKHRNIALLSTREPDLCASDPTRVLMRQIISAISQYEKSMIVLKLRGARQRKKVETGKCEGRKPYGYYEYEKSTYRLMRDYQVAGMSSDRIATRLNLTGHAPRYGQQWSERMVRRILAREKV